METENARKIWKLLAEMLKKKNRELHYTMKNEKPRFILLQMSFWKRQASWWRGRILRPTTACQESETNANRTGRFPAPTCSYAAANAIPSGWPRYEKTETKTGFEVFFLLPPHAPTQKATKRLFSWSNSLKWLGVEFVDCSLAIRNVQTEDVENYLKWLILAHFPNRNFLQGRPRSKC